MKERRVGAYVLEESLGQGGMGEVYRAHDSRLGRYVAIKHVRADRERPESRERLRREARALARLEHPAIVSIFDIVEAEDGDWLVMELVHGIRLDDLLLDGPLEPDQVLEYGERIAAGLAEAHDQGILHRDLKTENVMIPHKGGVRILDFGLARFQANEPGWESLSASGQVLGTVRAMSPEQARGLELDPRSDLFALGVLLYEMTTGVSPFAGPTPAATMTRVCTELQEPARALAPDLPEALSDLIDELLQKAPESRPQSAHDVARLLAGMRARDAREYRSPSEDPPPSIEPAVSTVVTPTLRDADRPDPRRQATNAERPGSGRGRARAWLALGLGGALLAGAIAFLAWPKRTASSAARLPPADARRGAHARQEHGRALLARHELPENVDQALALFARLVDERPRSAAAHAGLAQALLYQYKDHVQDPALLPRALGAAREAVALDEHLAWAQLALAQVLLEQGERDGARVAALAARALDPLDPGPELVLGQLASLGGDHQAARAAFLRARDLAPGDREVHDALGTVEYQLGHLEAAEAAFEKSIELAPDSIYGYRNLAAVLHAQERSDEAAHVLQRALEIRPSASLYGNLGTLQFFQGLYPQAATSFERALEVGDGAQDYWRWADLGDTYRQIPGRESDARDAYSVAIRLVSERLRDQPEHRTRQSRLALYLARSGDCAAARTEAERALDLGDLDGAAYFRVAVVRELCAQRAEALAMLEAALRAGHAAVEIEREPDLADLRRDPALQRILTQVAEDRP